MSLIFVVLQGTIGPNNCDTIVIGQLQIVIISTRTMSFSVITIHFDDKRRQSLVSFYAAQEDSSISNDNYNKGSVCDVTEFKSHITSFTDIKTCEYLVKGKAVRQILPVYQSMAEVA